ncbi:MAG: FAD-dependent monooxygenase [Planctomycetes bacterium]|nr:FAD-dependent monooxygenase [Planctomycetota bacterium]
MAKLSGVQLVVLEEATAGDHSTSGTGLNIGPNAIKALRLHEPELLADLLRVSAPWRRWRISDVDGTAWQDWDLRTLAEDAGIRIRWATLYDVLRERIRNWIQYESLVTRVQYNADGLLTVEYHSPNGIKRFDGVELLVAGDGRYSRVRRDLSGIPECAYYGVAIGRLMVPDTLGGLISDYEQWFNGPNRLLAFQVPADSIYIAATIPMSVGGEITNDLYRPDFLRARYNPVDRTACPAAAWIIDQLAGSASRIHWARFQDSSPCFRDERGRALYLGDAAHAMLPTLGQGATQAIEDACLAGTVFRARWDSIRDSPSGLPVLLRGIESLRLDRVRFAMALSINAADTIRALVDSEAGTREKQSPEFLAELSRLYGDVPSEAHVVAVMKEE